MNLDKYGLIIQSDGDGGDTAQREGFYYFTQKKNWLFCDFVNYDHGTVFDYTLAIAQLEIKPGLWCRHPNYPDTKDFSRDQTDPNIICMGSMDRTPQLNRLLKNQVKRFFFYQNGDLPMLLTFSLMIRAKKLTWLYPLLYIFDLGFMWCFIDALLKLNKADDVDDNNCVMRFAQAIETMPTLWSFLGRKLYAAFRPENNGTYHLNESNSVMAALAWYHRAESGGNPELAEAYRPLIMNYFKQK
jgi:hypothetical protein